MSFGKINERKLFNVKEKISIQRLIPLFLFVLLVTIGLVQRFDSVLTGNLSAQKTLVSGEPLLVNVDGYYYLRFARDLQKNSYSRIDEKRIVPDGAVRPIPPPLLSVLLAIFAKATPFSLNWVGAVLPALLGMSIAVPLYLFGRYWGDQLTALTAVAIGVTAHAYALRTSYGVLDTDCLNLTFALTCAYTFMRFGAESGVRRYRFLVGGFLSYGLFLWWWDTTPETVTLFALLPFFISLLFFYRPSPKEGVVFLIGMLIILFSFIVWQGLESINAMFEKIMSLFRYISKDESSTYFNPGISNLEQSIPTLQQVINYTTHSTVVFILSAVGIVLLVFKKKVETLYLLPVLTVGLMGVFMAERFIMFLVPVVSLGLGFFLSRVCFFIPLKLPAYLLCGILLLYIIGLNFSEGIFRTPIYSNKAIHGMEKIARITPQDALVWSWWNEGHPLLYWGDRGTLGDGMYHGAERSHFIGAPLCSDNFRYAANFMQFYGARGMRGIHHFLGALQTNREEGLQFIADILAGGPEQARMSLYKLPFKQDSAGKDVTKWLEFFFPSFTRSIYLYIDERLMRVASWVYWYGTWDTEKQSGDRTLPTAEYNTFFVDDQGRPMFFNQTLDYQYGTAQPDFSSSPLPLYQIVITDNDKSIFHNYEHAANGLGSVLGFTDDFELPPQLEKIMQKQGRYQLEIYSPGKYAVLQDMKKADMIINRLFWRKNDYPSKYFKPVDLNTPYYQIWKVEGDRLP